MNKCFSVLRLGTCMPWSAVSWAFSNLTVWFMISAYPRKCTSCIPRGSSCFQVLFARGIDSVGTREFGVGLPGRLDYQTRYQKEVLESENDKMDSDDGGDDSKCIFPCGPDAHYSLTYFTSDAHPKSHPNSQNPHHNISATMRYKNPKF